MGRLTGCRTRTGKEQSTGSSTGAAVADGCTAGTETGSCMGLRTGGWQRARVTGVQG